jgi:hypothetical protein
MPASIQLLALRNSLAEFWHIVGGAIVTGIIFFMPKVRSFRSSLRLLFYSNKQFTQGCEALPRRNNNVKCQNLLMIFMRQTDNFDLEGDRQRHVNAKVNIASLQQDQALQQH